MGTVDRALPSLGFLTFSCKAEVKGWVRRDKRDLEAWGALHARCSSEPWPHPRNERPVAMLPEYVLLWGHESVTSIPYGWILFLRETRLGSSLIHVQLTWSCWAISWITSFNTQQIFISNKFRSHLPKAYNWLKVEPIRSPNSKVALPSLFGAQDPAGKLTWAVKLKFSGWHSLSHCLCLSVSLSLSHTRAHNNDGRDRPRGKHDNTSNMQHATQWSIFGWADVTHVLRSDLGGVDSYRSAMSFDNCGREMIVYGGSLYHFMCLKFSIIRLFK